MEYEGHRQLERKIVVLVILVCALFGLLVIANQVNPVIEIPDHGLRGAVRDKINRESGPIYRKDVMLITELDASNRGISSLEGIQYFNKLVTLNLENNRVRDLSPLSGSSMLRDLHLGQNYITDLQTISFGEITHLPLRQLDLSNNLLGNGDLASNFSQLTLLDQLEILRLGGNHIQTFSGLSSLNNLQVLDLRENEITDINELNQFNYLQEINLRDNFISDLSTLEHIQGLTYLNIHSNPVEHGLDALGTLVNLETLIMRNVYIGDNSGFLRNLRRLNNLNIRNTSISDLSPLVDLMEAGVLQDQPQHGSQATVNVLELGFVAAKEDPYLDLRPYWENISYRSPLSLPYYPSPVKAPLFSHPAGFYQEGFYLEITTQENGGKIYYTVDGSEPSIWRQDQPDDSTKLYAEPIWVQNRTSEPNRLSAIVTTKAEPVYIPEEPVFKGTVIRAIVVDAQGRPSDVVTNSYFVEEGILERYTLPVVSIVTDEKGLFDPEIGIYVPGNNWEIVYPQSPWHNPANYQERGLKSERPAHLEIIDHSGQVRCSMNIGIRIHGLASRFYAHKSLRLYAREEYDHHKAIEYDFFPALNNRGQTHQVETFRTLILRNGGNERTWSMLRDELAQSLLVSTSLDIQGFYPVVVFINGDYWGIHSIRNRYDEHYFESYYGIKSEDLSVLERNVTVKIGNEEDRQAFFDVLRVIDPDFLANEYKTINTLADPVAYQRIEELIDIENFIDHYVAQIYFGNGDWPGNNVMYWRYKTENNHNIDNEEQYGYDGRWRWVIMDVDWGLWEPRYNALYESTREDGDEWFNAPWSTYLIRSLLQNDGFRDQFINRFADTLNTIFREEVVLRKTSEIKTIYQPEIDEHTMRWRYVRLGSSEEWRNNVSEIENFAFQRPNYQRQHIIEYFNLAGSFNLSAVVEPSHGHIKINSIEIKEGVIGVDNPANWSGVYFIGIPIEITAIPEEGFRFVRWEGPDFLGENSYSPIISLIATEDVILQAVFDKE